jgi:hypothetical protein
LLAELEYVREQQSLSEKLVERYLAQVIDSCGSKNKHIAKQVLYLLTDEKNTCPLKSRKELELELDVKAEQLDLVLEKLVESGILLKKLAFPTEQYQLFHDYLSYFVRQEQSARLFTELQKEREQRKLSEAKLSELMKQLQKTRQELIWKVTLGIIAGVFGILEAFMYLW